MAAQLHGHALHVLARQGGQLFAHGRGAGEGDLADQRVRDQVVRDLGRCAVDQTDDARRHARIMESADQLGRGCGRFFGRFDDDGAAGSQSGRHLAHGLVDREVPGREGGNRPHGQLEDLLLHLDVAWRHDAAIHAAAFFGKPLDDVGGRHGLDFGFGQGLALFLGEQFGNLRGAFAHQGCGLAHDRAALVGGHIAPQLETLLRGLRSPLQVGDAGMGQAADFGAGGGVEHGQGAAAFGIAPLAIDEELGVGVSHKASSGQTNKKAIVAGNRARAVNTVTRHGMKGHPPCRASERCSISTFTRCGM